MFNRTVNKLNDTRNVLDNLRQASDFQNFRSLFNSFLSAARAITYTLQKEGKSIKGFGTWYANKQTEMKNDELLRFFHNARIDDVHKGKHQLRSSLYINNFSTKQVTKPDDPNASMVIGTEGPFWIVNKGTPKEKKIPIKEGRYRVTISVDKAPQTHLGKRIFKNDPITLCEIVVGYFENLVHEAKTRFS